MAMASEFVFRAPGKEAFYFEADSIDAAIAEGRKRWQADTDRSHGKEYTLHQVASWGEDLLQRYATVSFTMKYPVGQLPSMTS